ncbi:conserved hypothetical protein [Hyphomicrobiales bacterium]|nr:conserved hypothetical protein [Hyphomicrobiales bacterium]
MLKHDHDPLKTVTLKQALRLSERKAYIDLLALVRANVSAFSRMRHPSEGGPDGGLSLPVENCDDDLVPGS